MKSIIFLLSIALALAADPVVVGPAPSDIVIFFKTILNIISKSKLCILKKLILYYITNKGITKVNH